MSVYEDCWTLLCILSLTFPVVSTSKQPLSAQTTTKNHHYIKLFDVSNHTTKDVIRTKSNIQPCNEPTCLFTLFFGSTSINIHLIDHFDHYNHHSVPLTRTSHGPTDVAARSSSRNFKKNKFHDGERVYQSQNTHSPFQTTSTTVFERVRMQKCQPTTS